MLREEKWIGPAAILAVAALVSAFVLTVVTDFPGRPNGFTSLKTALAIIALAGGLRFARFIFQQWRAGEPHPLQQIRVRFQPALTEFIPVLVGVGVVGVFLSSMTFLKSMIVAVVPFWADATFAELDRLVGVSPAGLGKLFQPIITELGWFYGLWHAVQLGGILWVLHWRDRDAKSRLILAFMLTWALGMLAAYVFSSAGPIFTGSYDPALAPESVRRVSQFLWSNYLNGTALLGGGISAFPSMHVAIAVWFALVLRNRGLPLLGLSYAAAVFACSVILGWHYAADGIGGGAIALGANWVAAAWLRHRSQSPPETAISAQTA